MIEKRGFYFIREVREYAQNHPVVKFLLVFLAFVVYLIFTSSKFGFVDGVKISLLTWSFFVFCTPIADAGILVDFPIRLFTGVRMIYSEVVVWVIAAVVNVYVFIFYSHLYSTTILTSLFHKILVTPFPYWAIIILSAIGTFFSVYFADEVLDVLSKEKKKREFYEKHKIKHKWVLFIFLLVFIGMLYYFLLNSLGLKIPLF